MNDRRYAMNVAVSEMAFWNEPRDTWEKIGSVVPGVEMMFGGPRDDDASKQIQELKMLISQNVSGIVVFSNDPNAVAPVIDHAIEQGIPVITAFADVPSKRLTYIGTNQKRLAGEIANRVMEDFKEQINLITGRPKALIALGRKESQDQWERAQGIRDAIGRSIDLVGCVEDRFNASVAEQEILKAFDTYIDIDFIFGCNSQSAIGAVDALKRLKKKRGEVVVTGWDTEQKVMEQIEADREDGGWIHATAVLHSSYMVQVCFAILEAENFGYSYPDTLNTRELRLPAIPDTIEIPMKNLVTSKNVNEYLGK